MENSDSVESEVPSVFNYSENPIRPELSQIQFFHQYMFFYHNFNEWLDIQQYTMVHYSHSI